MPNDLVLLVADKNIEHSIAGLLTRPAALGIRVVEGRTFVHPRRDPGCLREEQDFLRPFHGNYAHGLVVFDRCGCGREHLSAEALATDVEQRLGISAETVERIVRNRIADAKGKQIDPRRSIERLGMDEISMRKGHKGYATIMTDLTDPSKLEILAVAKGRDEEAGRECLQALSEKQRSAVRFHHTDMGPSYLAACRALLPNSQSVIDRFHVAKKLGEVTDKLRKKTTELTDVDCPRTTANGCVP